jgi:hypothetical protein
MVLQANNLEGLMADNHDNPTPAEAVALIPPSELIRKRLAVTLTEADLLRRQLRVSALAEREAARLSRLNEGGPDRAE